MNVTLPTHEDLLCSLTFPTAAKVVTTFGSSLSKLSDVWDVEITPSFKSFAYNNFVWPSTSDKIVESKRVIFCSMATVSTWERDTR